MKEQPSLSSSVTAPLQPPPPFPRAADSAVSSLLSLGHEGALFFSSEICSLNRQRSATSKSQSYLWCWGLGRAEPRVQPGTRAGALQAYSNHQGSSLLTKSFA